MQSDKTAQRLRALTNFPAIIGFLSRDLDWPLEQDNIVEEDLDDLTFEYTPDNLGIAERYSAKITNIRQLRNLVNDQPWGIFYIEFESRRLPVTALRRVLGRLVRATEDRPSWQTEDLLFICVQGAADERGVAFAHFRQGDNTRQPELRTFSWDSRESHFYYIRNLNLEKLRWPPDDTDHDAWREQWRSAFTTRHREVIRNAEMLAREMAKQAREIRELIEDLYSIEVETGSLHTLFERFKKGLLHDLTPESFADVVAQTVTYGLFSAAQQQNDLHINQIVTAIPQTNPFLRDLLDALISDDMLDLSELGVNRLIEMYREADVPRISQDFMRETGSGDEDPVIHFYEQFLSQYDRGQRVERGVFYTPNPVVSYIVRSVDHLLKTEFGIEDGLASSAKATNPATGDQEHIVQVLDPATGTGTFLQYIIEEIARAKNPDAKPTPEWNRYVAEDLLPRLNGFELMMAPYTVAHMKLGLKLEQTGYRFERDQRLRVFLTNALDKPVEMQETLLTTDYLSKEANEAAIVKEKRSILVIIGNPPYLKSSATQNDWIEGLMEEYKKTIRYEETQIQGLSNDYIKFLRFAHWKIVAQTKQGVIGFVTGSGYLDGRLARDMRQSLLSSFTTIYILNLHGSIRKSADVPSGKDDENVFEIQQGVAIIIAVKSIENQETGTLFYADVWGNQFQKYEYLLSKAVDSTSWELLSPREPYYYFVPIDTTYEEEYNNYYSVTSIFGTGNPNTDKNKKYATGFATQQDTFAIAFDRKELYSNLSQFIDSTNTEEELRKKFRLCTTNQWNFERARANLSEMNWDNHLVGCLYRPLDFRKTLYTSDVVSIPRLEIMAHLLSGQKNHNLAFLCCQTINDQEAHHFFVADRPVEKISLSSKTSSSAFVFPLYLQPATDDLFQERTPNLNPTFISLLNENLGLKFISTGRGDLVSEVGPEDIFYYMYAVFHSKQYRERYNSLLKRGFPRLPLTTDLVLFNKLCGKGADLVALHLLDDDYAAASWNLDGEESPLKQHGVTFHQGDDGCKVGKFNSKDKNYDNGRVYLDKSQKDGISYFEGIEREVWEFQIGGYQVLNKWLYDRRPTGSQEGRTLTDEDIEHYKRVVAALRTTIAIMSDIDKIIDAHGGWPLVGSQPEDPDEEEQDMPDGEFPKSEKDLFGRTSPQMMLGDQPEDEQGTATQEDQQEAPPDDLTSDMIDAAYQTMAGVEPETDDESQRMSTETDEDEDEEEDIQPFDPTKITIVQRTLSVDQLMRKIRDFEESEGEFGMNLNPDFQRMGGIWNNEKMSRLIESMMIRIPLPAFYMNEAQGNEDLWLVIDGLQRLTTMRRFIIDKTLKLKKLEFWKEYEGYTFDELPLTLRRRIEETQVNLYLVKEGTPHNVKFNIFKRINTGGAPLSGQEIRHALNQGPATDMLAAFADSAAFEQATDGGVSSMRMTDRECVLRYLAFMDKDEEQRDQFDMKTAKDYSRKDELDSFLNDQLKALNTYLGSRKQLNEERLDQLRQRFERVMLATREIFDNRAFRKPNNSNRRSPVSKALFEVWAVNLDRCTDDELNILKKHGTELEVAFAELMDDTDFVISISYSTGDHKRVSYRHQRIHDIIRKIIDNV